MISKIHAWMMWFIISIFYAYQYILRVMPSIMIDDIMAIWQINIAEFGQLPGIYYIGYSLMHLPLGILLDRYKPKIVIPLCIILCIMGLIPLLYSKVWFYPLLGRFLIGIGSSAAILGSFKIIRIGFTEDKFTKMLGLTVMIGLLGAIYGGGPLYYLKSQIGFYKTIHALIIAGIILAIISYFIIPKTETTNTGLKDVFSSVIKNKSFIVICILSGLMVGPIEGFADVWGKTYLKIVYSLSDELSSSLPSLIFIGMCFGAPFLGYLAQKSGNYFYIIALSALVITIGFIIFMMIKIPIIFISCLFIIIGVFSSYQIIAIYKASTYVNSKFSSSANAIANMIIMFFGYLFHTVISSSINIFTPTMNEFILNLGISIIPLASFAAFIGFIILNINKEAEI